tara:strand:+ start:1736 stop:1936 length:201 start_codon:yes stop_codon:yes gene_type:complete
VEVNDRNKMEKTTEEKTIGEVLKFKLSFIAFLMQCNRLEEADKVYAEALELCDKVTQPYEREDYEH